MVFTLLFHLTPQKKNYCHLILLLRIRNNRDILSDTRKFTAYINQKLIKAKALYGIGGYDEHRTVYSISKVFDADKPGEEPRRLHLGTDIWGSPYTKVMAPLDGIVHSFAFNNRLW